MADERTAPVVTRALLRLKAFGRGFPWWPPDMFGVVATLFSETDLIVHTRVARYPRDGASSAWVSDVRAVADQWVRALNAAADDVEFKARKIRSVRSIRCARGGNLGAVWNRFREAVEREGVAVDDAHLADDALFLLAVSDEAGRVIVDALLKSEAASPASNAETDASPPEWLTFYAELLLLSSEKRTISALPSKIVRVLPKEHTPSTGLSLRSLSHHLAAVRAGAVDVEWLRPAGGPRATVGELDILVAPWPLDVPRSWFKEDTLFGGHGYFRLDRRAPTPPEQVAAYLTRLLQRVAHSGMRRPDFVVMPELALTIGDLDAVKKLASEHELTVVAGVQVDAGEELYGVPGPANLAWTCFGSRSIGWSVRGLELNTVLQPKHHRWRLDQSQVDQYHLQGHLGLGSAWWEAFKVQPRSLRLLVPASELTIANLICEDLARQDPVVDVIRAIGPNLVLALLMDGPQISTRWGARYAAVLADDPGSSVLVVTSLGMSKLTQEKAAEAGWPDRHRVVALWRDPIGARDRVVDLPEGCSGAMLHLRVRGVEEVTADGRSARSACPELAGISYVRTEGEAAPGLTSQDPAAILPGSGERR